MKAVVKFHQKRSKGFRRIYSIYLKKYLKGLQSMGKCQFDDFCLHAWMIGVSLISLCSMVDARHFSPQPFFIASTMLRLLQQIL